MKKRKAHQSYNVIPFTKEYNDISVLRLEEILETLEDVGYLSDKGIEFRKAFWRLYINK